jgi:Uri superfamily endonuclease
MSEIQIVWFAASIAAFMTAGYYASVGIVSYLKWRALLKRILRHMEDEQYIANAMKDATVDTFKKYGGSRGYRRFLLKEYTERYMADLKSGRRKSKDDDA